MEKKYFVDNIEFDADIVMEMFRGVFEYIGSHVLDYDDLNLECEIYEDYDIQYMNLADWRLEILLDSGHITNDIKLKAQEMYQLSKGMFGDDVERTAQFIRTSPEWQKIVFLADEIKNFISKI